MNISKKIVRVFILYTLFIVPSCNINRSINPKSSNLDFYSNYKQLAFEKYQLDTLCTLSPGKSYVLCLKTDRDTLLNPNSLVMFFVFSEKKQKIVYEDAIAGAHISWENDSLLLIIQQRGIKNSMDDSGKIRYLINLNTLNKIPINKKQINN